MDCFNLRFLLSEDFTSSHKCVREFVHMANRTMYTFIIYEMIKMYTFIYYGKSLL